MKTVPPNLLAIAAKCAARHREMCALFTSGELEVYKALCEKRVNAKIARLTPKATKFEELRAEREQLRAEIEKQKFALKTLANHERAKLSSSLLSNYCRPETLRNGRTYIDWPTYYFLGSVTGSVVNYLKFTGEASGRHVRNGKLLRYLISDFPLCNWSLK